MTARRIALMRFAVMTWVRVRHLAGAKYLRHATVRFLE